MSRRGIVLAIAALLIVIAVSDGGAFAALSDTEAVPNNKFTAASSKSWVQTTQADFEKGTGSGVDADTGPGEVRLPLRGGGVTPHLFAFGGGNSRAFYRYDIAANNWEEQDDAPGEVKEGASLVFDNARYIYALQGSSSAFWRYDTLGKHWTDLMDAPGEVGSGGDLAYDDGVLYALQGGGGKGLWSYDTASGTWTELESDLEGVGRGGALVSYQGALYIMNGGKGDNALTIWKYKDGVWSNLALPLGWEYWMVAGRGMEMGSDGRLYTLYAQDIGSGRTRFYSYDLGTGAWAQKHEIWENHRDGVDLASDGNGHIYALTVPGGQGSAHTFWRYNIGGNNWDNEESAGIADLPAVGPGACLVSASAGRYYVPQGVLISSTLDTEAPGTVYDALFWDAGSPSGTTVSLEVRASDTRTEEGPSAPWVSVSTPGPLAGLSGRYVQWKAVLSTDDVSKTPVLQEVRLYYWS